ncbi:MAG TPA: hypothetical protein VHW72_07455 [Candidatus Angelobacter sp.]|nr:hypothetical protein [Candidatus Angelobacter sp.]
MAASFIRKSPIEQRSSLLIVVPDADKTVKDRLPITRRPSHPLLKQRPPTLLHHTQLHPKRDSLRKETSCLNRWCSGNPVKWRRKLSQLLSGLIRQKTIPGLRRRQLYLTA